MEKQNSQLEHGQPMEQTRGLFCTRDSGVAFYQIRTLVSLLVNSYNVRSILSEEVSFAAVNQICVIHVAMNNCKKLKIQ